MILILIIILITVLVILSYETLHGYYRQINRKKLYSLAVKQSNDSGRKLIVVGDPHNGFGSMFFNTLLGQSYDVKDILIDINPCEYCLANYKVLNGDLCEQLKTLESDKYVIYISFVLEYILNLEETISEIYRVCGSNANIFVNYIDENSLISRYYPSFLFNHNPSTNIITEAPPNSTHIKFKKI